MYKYNDTSEKTEGYDENSKSDSLDFDKSTSSNDENIEQALDDFEKAKTLFKKEISIQDKHFLGPVGVFFMVSAAFCFMFMIGIIIYGFFDLLKIPISSPWVFISVMIFSNLSFVFLTVFASTKLNIYKETVSFSGKLNLKIIILMLFLLPAVFFGGAHLELLYQRLISWAPSYSLVDNFAQIVIYEPIILILILFATSVIAPVSEEMFFRGFLLNSLKNQKLSNIFIVVFTSLLFAAIHVQLRGFVMIFVIGSVCAILSLISGNLRLPVIFHSIYNTLVISIGVLPLLLKKPVFQGFEEVYKKESTPQLPAVFVSIAVFLFGAMVSYLILREINTELKRNPKSS